MTKFDIEIEKSFACTLDEGFLTERAESEIKSHLGVRPRKVHLLKDGDLPRATHKAKRVIDLR
jgi:phenylacetate-CoA ligase